jgi:hypothetical protein
MNVAGFEALELTPDERLAIGHGNAARLFPRLASRHVSIDPTHPAADTVKRAQLG